MGVFPTDFRQSRGYYETSLRGLLYSRHTLVYLHRGEAARCPLRGQDQSPQPGQYQDNNPLFAC